MSTNTRKIKSKMTYYPSLLVPLFTALLLSGCNSAYKKLVTYHVEFVADGVHYSRTIQYPWYYIQTFEYTRHYADYNKSSIHGFLKNGSGYIIDGSSYYYYESGHTDTKSTIFVRITPTIVESFDLKHFHSPHHQIHITQSYVNIRNEGEVPYNTAVDVDKRYRASQKYLSYYFSVGAKITPFSSTTQTEDDFYNTSPSPFQAPGTWKKPEFNFHPADAVIGNSDADITYDGKLFHAAFPGTGLATTWVLAPDVHLDGIGISGQRPSIITTLNGKEVIIKPMGRMVKAGINTVTGKAVLFYECDASLHF